MNLEEILPFIKHWKIDNKPQILLKRAATVPLLRNDTAHIHSYTHTAQLSYKYFSRFGSKHQIYDNCNWAVPNGHVEKIWYTSVVNIWNWSWVHLRLSWSSSLLMMMMHSLKAGKYWSVLLWPHSIMQTNDWQYYKVISLILGTLHQHFTNSTCTKNCCIVLYDVVWFRETEIFNVPQNGIMIFPAFKTSNSIQLINLCNLQYSKEKHDQ